MFNPNGVPHIEPSDDNVHHIESNAVKFSPEQIVQAVNTAQLNLFSQYFKDEYGGRAILEDDEAYMLIKKYSKAFRDFCENISPEIAQRIYVNHGEIQSLPDYEINELVLYMKSHPADLDNPPTVH